MKKMLMWVRAGIETVAVNLPSGVLWGYQGLPIKGQYLNSSSGDRGVYGIRHVQHPGYVWGENIQEQRTEEAFFIILLLLLFVIVEFECLSYLGCSMDFVPLIRMVSATFAILFVWSRLRSFSHSYGLGYVHYLIRMVSATFTVLFVWPHFGYVSLTVCLLSVCLSQATPLSTHYPVVGALLFIICIPN